MSVLKTVISIALLCAECSWFSISYQV